MWIDKGHNRLIYSPVCTRCKFWNAEMGARETCKAFPKGIPAVIWNGENDHTRPYPGDNGIRFEEKDTTTNSK